MEGIRVKKLDTGILGLIFVVGIVIGSTLTSWLTWAAIQEDICSIFFEQTTDYKACHVMSMQQIADTLKYRANQ